MFQISSHINFNAVILVQLHGRTVYFKCELPNINERKKTELSEHAHFPSHFFVKIPGHFLSWLRLGHHDMLWVEFWRSRVSPMARCTVCVKHLPSLCLRGADVGEVFMTMAETCLGRSVRYGCRLMCSLSGTELGSQACWGKSARNSPVCT